MPETLTPPILVWSFLGPDARIRLERPHKLRVGDRLRAERPGGLASPALSGSRTPLAALGYAPQDTPGLVVCRLALAGVVDPDTGKARGLEDDGDEVRAVACTVIAMADASAVLQDWICGVAEGALQAAGMPDARSLAVLQAKRQWLSGEWPAWDPEAGPDPGPDARLDAARAEAYRVSFDVQEGGLAGRAAEAAAKAAARSGGIGNIVHSVLSDLPKDLTGERAALDAGLSERLCTLLGITEETTEPVA